VRFAVDFRVYRRYNELTEWGSFVKKHFPEIEIPRDSKLRNHFKRQIERQLLEDPEFRMRHGAFQSKIDLACQLSKKADTKPA